MLDGTATPLTAPAAAEPDDAGRLRRENGELRAEIARLRARLAGAGLDLDDAAGHRGELTAARAAAETARRAADAASADLAGARAESAALAVSEARLAAILESAADFAIITTDLDGRITSWNRGAENVLGWREEEALGRDARMIFTPEDRAAAIPESEMWSARHENRAEDVRWHLQRDGGRFWASGLMMPLRGADGEGELRG